VKTAVLISISLLVVACSGGLKPVSFPSVESPASPESPLKDEEQPFKLSAELEWIGKVTSDKFGKVVAGGADLDGDGVGDIVAGLPFHPVPGVGDFGTYVGRIEIYSGADGHLIRAKDGQREGGFFGSVLAVVPDKNGDGVSDLTVFSRGQGTPEDLRTWRNMSFAAAIDIHSGLDLSRIAYGGHHHVCGGTACAYDGIGRDYENSYAELGDLDGDGLNDTITGSPGYWGGNGGGAYSYKAGEVFLIGYRKRVARFSMNTENGAFGRSVAALADVDNDGIPDYAAGEPGFDKDRGRVWVFSGKTHQSIAVFNGENQGDSLGTSLASGDFDGDGEQDLAMGAPYARVKGAQAVGRVYIYNIQSGRLLAVKSGSPQGVSLRNFGCSLANGGRAPSEQRDRLIVGEHAGCEGASVIGALGGITLFKIEGQ